MYPQLPPRRNGDFESGTTNWTFTGLAGEVIDNSSSANHTTHVLNLWTSNEEEIVISASYAVKLTEGKYHFEFDVEGAESDSRLSYTVKAGETSLYTSDSTVVTTGWDKWTTLRTGEFELSEPTEVTFAISGTGPVGYWGHLDNLVLIGTGKIYTEIVLDHTPTLAVEKVSGINVGMVQVGNETTGAICGESSWENAWIPVEYAYNEDGTLNETILASNKAKWEKFGSGWAASYGGSAVDNQAMFDFVGKALDSLYTWKYMMVGTEDLVDKKVESVDKTEISVENGRTRRSNLPSQRRLRSP